MKKDKLNDACDTAFLADYFPSATESPDPRWELFADGFKQGVEWLMGQPLSERMTEGEKSRYREWYLTEKNNVHSFYDDEASEAQTSVELLERIFGKEMFEQ